MNGPQSLGVLLLAALGVVVAALYFRYRNLQLLHQERMAAIEKGTAVPVGRTLAPWSPRVYLLRGLIWSMSGIALAVFLFGIAVASHRRERLESAVLDAKYLSEQANIPMEEARKIIEADRDLRGQGVPPAVALLGLIPLGIGLAYLAFYYTDESRHADGASAESRMPVAQH